jgi:hypothetical protein
MTCRLVGFPLMATAQARREAALGCRVPLVDCACAACGGHASFAAWADMLALAAIACRRCGAVGHWRLAGGCGNPRPDRDAGATAAGGAEPSR